MTSRVGNRRSDREPLVVRAVIGAHRLIQHGYQGLKGLVDGLWLALLPRATLAAVGESYYRRQAMFVNADYNEAGLWVWERDAVDRFMADGARIAVTGAGGGREVLALAQIGYDVVGYECDRAMVDFGNRLLARHDVAARLEVCLPDCWPAGGDTFDAVIVGWGSYTHVRGRADRVMFLRGARDSMPDGGTIVLSFFDRTPATSGYLRTVRAVGGAVRRVVPGPPVEYGDGLMPHFGHYFNRAEIADELASAGFDLVDFQVESYARAIGRATPRI